MPIVYPLPAVWKIHLFCVVYVMSKGGFMLPLADVVIIVSMCSQLVNIVWCTFQLAFTSSKVVAFHGMMICTTLRP